MINAHDGRPTVTAPTPQRRLSQPSTHPARALRFGDTQRQITSTHPLAGGMTPVSDFSGRRLGLRDLVPPWSVGDAVGEGSLTFENSVWGYILIFDESLPDLLHYPEGLAMTPASSPNSPTYRLEPLLMAG